MGRGEKEKSRYLEGIVAIILLTVAIYVIVIILKDPVAEPEIIMENRLAEILWDNFDESKIKIIEGEAEMAHIETLYDDTMRNKDTEFLDYDGKKYITSDFLIEEGKVDLSRELFEMTISDKEENVIRGYGIKTINEDYIIAIKYGDKYFKYINMSYIPDNLDDFFEIIGSKDNVEISYVEVLLGQDLKTVGKYVYQNNIDEWAWDLFDNRVHNTVEKGLVHHKHRVEQDFILRWGDVNIRVENKQANIEYLIQFGLNADTIKIYDTRYGLYDFCFDFSKEELSYALKELVENYEAYKVEQ